MDEYADIAPFYDLEHADFVDDIAFYRGFLQEGPVLEVGCGSGRIMQQLLRDGFEVWGIDPSPTMLERARKNIGRHARAHLHLGTIADFVSPTQFPSALIPLNTLWHISTVEERVTSLQALRQVLTDNGLLIVDQSNPFTLADRDSAGEVRQRFSRRRSEDQVRAFSISWDDQAQQLLEMELIYDVTRDDNLVSRYNTRVSMRYMYRFELELLLRAATFRIESLYGSYDLDPYTSDSPNIIAVCRAV